MKKVTLLITALLLSMGFAQAQDIYVSGNHFTTGKVLKNNTLLYSITDSIDIQLKGIQVAEDGTVYGAGYAYNNSEVRGKVWMNDSCIFIADTNTYFDHIALNGNNWIVAGINNVWQNGELLYSYSHGEDECHIHSLAVDTTTSDIYAGGAIYLSGEYLTYASVWKNDSLLWMEDTVSSVENICFDGGNLYAAGFKVANDSLSYGVVWQNDSIIYQIENANFGHIAAFGGSLYWSGISLTDTVVYIWQDGEVLYDLPEISGVSNLVVNESGVYYTDAQTVYKDGEILYQLEECIISDLVVKPTPPQPTYTITVESDNPEWGTVSGSGEYHYGDTIQIEAIPNVGHEFLMWNDSITDNPRDIVITQDSTFVALFAVSQYTITVVSDNPAWGNVTGGGIFYYGDTIKIAATAYLGFEFVSWIDGNTDNPRTIIVTESQEYKAHFGIQQCIIKTDVTPENSGTVNGGGTYDYGTIIHLVAHSNPGYVYSEWDDGVLDNPRAVLVEGDAIYTAVFTPLQYEIHTVSDPENGGIVTGSGTYNYGATATLKASPNDGFIFLCWQDGIVTNPRNITVTGNATYTALFYQNGTPTYTITVQSNDTTLGTVSGGGEYPKGSTIEIAATPAANAYFVSWDDGNTDNPRSVVVTRDMTFIANFNLIPSYTIIVVSESPTMGSVYGGGNYAANSIVTIGANPAQGYHFTGWQDGNIDNPRQITVTGNATYTASFAPIPVQSYTVTVYYDDAQGYVLGAGTYVESTIATLVAIPNDEYRFSKWSDGNTDNHREIIVNHDIILAAFFDGTGLDENDSASLVVYPNPADDHIRIEGLEAKSEIGIYNMMGVRVKSMTLCDDDDINIGNLAAGIYLIRINGNLSVKFVKR